MKLYPAGIKKERSIVRSACIYRFAVRGGCCYAFLAASIIIAATSSADIDVVSIIRS
jgi:hypothetical protein